VTDWPNGLAVLRAKPAADLVAIYSGIGPTPGSSGHDLLCLDGAVLAQSPADVFAAGKQAAVPLLIGSNADEGTIFAMKGAPTTVAAYQATLRKLAPGMMEQILALYPAKTDADAKAAYTAALGDASFTATARRAARWHADAGHATYRYVFGRVTRVASALHLGAFHGAEIPFAFGNIDGRMYRAEDRTLSAAISACWVSFAKTGAPARADWTRYDAARDNYLYFDTAIAAQAGFRTAKCDLWDRLAVKE
jgi:para-nitrobenzyl esterase